MARFRKRYRRRYGSRYRRRLDLRDPAAVLKAIGDQYDADNMRGSINSRRLYGLNNAAATGAQRIARLRAGWRGPGDYSSWKPWLQRWVPKGALAAAGGWLGGLAGGPAGGAAGTAIGSAASKYLGWGKYRRKNYKGRGDYGGDAGGNQIMAGSTDVPMTVNASSSDLSGDVYLSHREFLGNIQATGGAGNISPFKINTFPINAGLAGVFPWLSQIAQNFEMYELHGCIFEYKPTSGELGATGTNALGKVVMATNYDPDAPAFSSTIQMENYDYSNACKPSEHMLHGIETAKHQRVTNMLFVRTGNTTRDKIFTDYGVFSIATEGLPITAGVSANIGELWVSYRVKLSRAQLYGALLGQNVLFDQHLAVSSVANLTANTAAYLASTGYPTEYTNSPALTFFPWTKNSLGCVVTQNTVNQSIKIVFPDNIAFGVFRVSFEITGNASTITFNAPTFNGNCLAKVYNGIDGQPTTNAFSTNPLVASSNNIMQICMVGITAAPVSTGNNFMVMSWLAADATNNKLQTVTISLIPAV